MVNTGRRISESAKATVTENGVTDQSADHSTAHSNTDNSSSSSSVGDSLQQYSDTTAGSDSLQSVSQQHQQQQQQEMVMAAPSDPAADNLFRVFLVFGEMRSNGVKPDNAGKHQYALVSIVMLPTTPFYRV
jgi:hypothetical protein